MLRRIRGQSTAEYAIVIGLVIGAAVAMQVYVKRGIQARIKDAVDHTDASDGITRSGQYEPYYLTSDVITSREATTAATTGAGGTVTRKTTADTTSRTGTTTVEAVSE